MTPQKKKKFTAQELVDSGERIEGLCRRVVEDAPNGGSRGYALLSSEQLEDLNDILLPTIWFPRLGLLEEGSKVTFKVVPNAVEKKEHRKKFQAKGCEIITTAEAPPGRPAAAANASTFLGASSSSSSSCEVSSAVPVGKVPSPGKNLTRAATAKIPTAEELVLSGDRIEGKCFEVKEGPDPGHGRGGYALLAWAENVVLLREAAFPTNGELTKGAAVSFKVLRNPVEKKNPKKQYIAADCAIVFKPPKSQNNSKTSHDLQRVGVAASASAPSAVQPPKITSPQKEQHTATAEWSIARGGRISGGPFSRSELSYTGDRVEGSVAKLIPPHAIVQSAQLDGDQMILALMERVVSDNQFALPFLAKQVVTFSVIANPKQKMGNADHCFIADEIEFPGLIPRVEYEAAVESQQVFIGEVIYVNFERDSGKEKFSLCKAPELRDSLLAHRHRFLKEYQSEPLYEGKMLRFKVLRNPDAGKDEKKKPYVADEIRPVECEKPPTAVPVTEALFGTASSAGGGEDATKARGGCSKILVPRSTLIEEVRESITSVAALVQVQALGDNEARPHEMVAKVEKTSAGQEDNSTGFEIVSVFRARVVKITANGAGLRLLDGFTLPEAKNPQLPRKLQQELEAGTGIKKAFARAKLEQGDQLRDVRLIQEVTAKGHKKFLVTSCRPDCVDDGGASENDLHNDTCCPRPSEEVLVEAQPQAAPEGEAAAGGSASVVLGVSTRTRGARRETMGPVPTKPPWLKPTEADVSQTLDSINIKL
eukprot:g4465.t1